jgi:hypothetical protein
MDRWTRFPKLLILSPERVCGNMTALERIEGFVLKGKRASSITAAALTRRNALSTQLEKIRGKSQKR